MPSPAPATARPTRAPRLRPGDRPAWWHASADREHFATWRAAASRQQLPVDVVVSLLVELDLVMTDLREAVTDPEAFLTVLVARPSLVCRLGPAGALRDWLARASPADDGDELPELVLPERVATRLAPGMSLAPRLCLDRIDLALACDRRAADHGRTLESWALHAALRHRSR